MSQLDINTLVQDTPEFRTWVQGLLHDTNISDLTITFTKQDGSDRDMKCTLVESSIPQDKQPKGTGKVHSKDVQRVFDLERQEWRSFKWANVKNVKFNIGDGK